MNDDKLKQIIEAALFAADGPLTVDQLLSLFPEEEGRPERDAVGRALEALAEECASRGVELKEVSSGLRFQVRPELAPWVSRLWEERPARYSRALLETLALVAYRQPITRGEIEDIRGVSVSTNIIKTLQEREWVRVVGHRDVPGRPAMYGTTKGFLDYFNLKSLDELPTLAELRDIDSINAELDLPAPGEVEAEAGPAEEAGSGAAIEIPAEALAAIADAVTADVVSAAMAPSGDEDTGEAEAPEMLAEIPVDGAIEAGDQASSEPAAIQAGELSPSESESIEAGESEASDPLAIEAGDAAPSASASIDVGDAVPSESDAIEAGDAEASEAGAIDAAAVPSLTDVVSGEDGESDPDKT